MGAVGRLSAAARLASLAALLAAAGPVAAQEPAFERLTIPLVADNKPDPADSTITGFLFKPQAAGRRPAVVLLHGCDGLDWKSRLPATWILLSEYARRYSDDGYLALIVDSFTPRGVDEVCGNPSQVSVPRRAWDALSAARYLADRPDVDGGRLVAQGDSQGGSTVLSALSAGRARAPARFAAGIAWYPRCDPYHGFSAPLLILIGTADDWTPAPRCTAMMTGLEGRGAAANVTLRTFPGATHAFDYPLRDRVNRLGHHLRFDEPATQEGWRMIDAFLAKVIG